MSNSPYSGEEVPLYPGDLRGYRGWLYFHGSTHALRAISYATTHWHSGVNVAKCRGGRPHDAPQVACACGFYAKYDWEGPELNLAVAGAVKASGRVILGRKGFRAERAEIEALCIPSSRLDHVAARRSLNRQFPGIPLFAEKGELIGNFPPVDRAALLGPEVMEEERLEKEERDRKRQVYAEHLNASRGLGSDMKTLLAAMEYSLNGPSLSGSAFPGFAVKATDVTLKGVEGDVITRMREATLHVIKGEK